MGYGKSSGKVILFGEHFVVYGLPAIVIPIDRYVEVHLKKGEQSRNPDYINSMLDLLKSKLDIKESFQIIEITSNLPVSAGLGSSAALSVALTKAVADELSLNLSNEEIFELSWNLENLFHKNSSGVDVYVSLYNRPVLYRKSYQRAIIDKISLNIDAKLGIKILRRNESTGDIVNDVREYSIKYPTIFENLKAAYRELFNEAIIALSSGDIMKLAELMNINQSLLRAIGVSNEEVDRTISDMISKGILGAKISGAGRGGAIIGLYESSDYEFDIHIELRSVK